MYKSFLLLFLYAVKCFPIFFNATNIISVIIIFTIPLKVCKRVDWYF